MSKTPTDIIIAYERFEDQKKGGTALQQAAARRELHFVEWDIEVVNVLPTGEPGDADHYLLTGELSERGRWGFGSRRWRIYASMVGDGLRERLLALKPGQQVRVSGNVSYAGTAFHIVEGLLIS